MMFRLALLIVPKCNGDVVIARLEIDLHSPREIRNGLCAFQNGIEKSWPYFSQRSSAEMRFRMPPVDWPPVLPGCGKGWSWDSESIHDLRLGQPSSDCRFRQGRIQTVGH